MGMVLDFPCLVLEAQLVQKSVNEALFEIWYQGDWAPNGLLRVGAFFAAALGICHGPSVGHSNCGAGGKTPIGGNMKINEKLMGNNKIINFRSFFGFCFIWALGGSSIAQNTPTGSTKVLLTRQTRF